MKKSEYLILIALFLLGLYLLYNSCLTCGADASNSSPTSLNSKRAIPAVSRMGSPQINQYNSMLNRNQNQIYRESPVNDGCNESKYQNCCLDYSNPGFYRCVGV
jgi:hypothetical protein